MQKFYQECDPGELLISDSPLSILSQCIFPMCGCLLFVWMFGFHGRYSFGISKCIFCHLRDIILYRIVVEVISVEFIFSVF